MGNEISKYSELRPASFGGELRKSEIQINLVLKLLSNAIKEERIIKKDDIVNCYLDFVFYEKELAYRHTLYRGESSRKDGWFTREELSHFDAYLKTPAIDWFRKSLGSAILKGKLLVIPIIEI